MPIALSSASPLVQTLLLVMHGIRHPEYSTHKIARKAKRAALAKINSMNGARLHVRLCSRYGPRAQLERTPQKGGFRTLPSLPLPRRKLRLMPARLQVDA